MPACRLLGGFVGVEGALQRVHVGAVGVKTVVRGKRCLVDYWSIIVVGFRVSCFWIDQAVESKSRRQEKIVAVWLFGRLARWR